jgi:hypothetical protein
MMADSPKREAGPVVDEILALIDGHLERLTSSTKLELAPRQYAAGGLARGSSLVRASRVTMRNELDDVVGLLARAVVEVTFVSLYVLHAGVDGLVRVLGATQRETDRLIEKLELEPVGGQAPTWDLPTNRLPFETIVSELGKSYEVATGQPFDASHLYDLIYRPLSAREAHAGGSIDYYVSWNAEHGRVIPHPRTLLPAETSLVVSSGFVAQLAHDVFEAFGIDTRELDELHETLIGIGQERLETDLLSIKGIVVFPDWLQGRVDRALE